MPKHHPIQVAVLSLALILSLAFSLSVIAQETAGDSQAKGTFYMYNPLYGTKNEYVFSGDELKTANLYDAGDGLQRENAETAIIHHNADGAVIYEERGRFLSMKLVEEEGPNFQFTFQKIANSETLEEAEKSLADAEDKDYDTLFRIPVFREEEADALEAMPSFTEIKREELLELLDRRETYGDLMEAFLAENEPRNTRMFAMRATQNMFHKDLIRKGYNPFADYEGEPFEKFKDDAEIQERLNKPIE